MPPAYRFTALLTCIVAVGLGGWWAATAGQGREATAAPVIAAPQATVAPANLAEPPLPTTSPHAPQAAPGLPAPPASAPRQALPPGWPPPPDLSRRQREIQLALSGDPRVRARAAAMHIQVCQSLEELKEWNEAHRQRRSEAEYRRTLANLAEDLPACQAIDAATRAQLVPLLRRSLADGDKGAAASLYQQLGKGFDPSAEPDIVAGLRRDALSCDEASGHALMGLHRSHPQVLTAAETGALRERARGWFAAQVESMRHAGGKLEPRHQAELDRLLDSLKPPPDADPAEVARLVADIQRHCTPPR